MQIDCLENGIEIVRTPEIAGVSDYDLATQTPFLAKWIVLRRDRLNDASIHPVRDDHNATGIEFPLVCSVLAINWPGTTFI